MGVIAYFDNFNPTQAHFAAILCFHALFPSSKVQCETKNTKHMCQITTQEYIQFTRLSKPFSHKAAQKN